MKSFFWLIVLLSSACGASHPSRPSPAIRNAPSSVQASPGARPSQMLIPPTREVDPNPLDWIEAESREIDRVPESDENAKTYLPLHDPLTRRLQFWADELDRQLRRDFPERFYDQEGQNIIPRPYLRLQLERGAKAFVSSATVCYRVPVRFAQAAGLVAPIRSDSLMQVSSQGTIGVIPRSEVSCIDRMENAQDPERIVRFLRESALIESCSFEASDGAVIMGADCKLAPGVRSGGAEGILLVPTTNRITLETGLFELFEVEGQLVNTLMHELAHFYLAHASLNKKAFNYFYRMTLANRLLPRPESDPLLRSLGLELLGLPKYRTQAVAGQTLHSELFTYSRLAINSLIDPSCPEGSSCALSCQKFKEIVEDPGAAFGTFPQAQLEGRALELYFSWEKELRSCFAHIPLREASEAGVVSRDAVKKIYWLSQIPPALPASYKLLDAVQSMHDVLQARDARSNELLQRALDEKLGYYTTEEEADNVALQWLPLLGLDPEFALEHWRRYAAEQAGREQESPFNFGFRRCENLFAAVPRWTEMGQTVPVPIGSFADIHHSSCFRLWNLEQRLRVLSQPIGPSRMEEAERHGGPYKILRRRVLEWHHQQRQPREKDCNGSLCTANLDNSTHVSGSSKLAEGRSLSLPAEF